MRLIKEYHSKESTPVKNHKWSLLASSTDNVKQLCVLENQSLLFGINAAQLDLAIMRYEADKETAMENLARRIILVSIFPGTHAASGNGRRDCLFCITMFDT